MILLGIAIYSWWIKDPVVASLNGDIEFSYQIEYPAGGSSGRLMPMLIALHGNGGKAKNLYNYVLQDLEKPVRVILIKAPILWRGDGAWPGRPADLKRYGTALSEVVKALVLDYPTIGKPALLGYSGGGQMAYYQAIVHGDSYSYIFPVSGMFNEKMLSDQPTRIGAKVYAFHGKSDSLVGFSGGLNAVNMLKDMGADATLTASDGGHQIISRGSKMAINQLIDEKLAQLF